MTEPTQSAPAEPTTAPTEPPAAPAAGTTTQDPFDPSSLSPEAKAYLRKQVDDANHKARTEARAAAAQAEREKLLAEFAEKLGLTPEGQALDPQTVADELGRRAQAAEDRLFTVGVRSSVYEQAAAAGAEAKLIFASQDFRDTLDDLVNDDPDTPEFRAAILQKMRDFVADNPEYATRGAAGPRPDPGQGARPTVVTDFKNADKAAFEAELGKYRLRSRTYG